MSFMFKPLAYDEPKAVNYIKLSQTVKDGVVVGNEDIAKEIIRGMHKKNKKMLAIDGYVSSTYTNEMFVKKLEQAANDLGIKLYSLNMTELYHSKERIDEIIAESLPLNYDDDPVLLFGRLYKGVIDDLIDEEKLFKLKDLKTNDGICVVHGLGSACSTIQSYVDEVAYVDVTPKVCAIRAREQKYINIGDYVGRPFNLLMRRNYFVDFEVAVKERKELLLNNKIDYYVLGSDENCLSMLKKDAFNEMLATLVKYPFRAKPVYLEGIWGGEFIRKVRNIPMDIAGNIAWIFEFIPMEVSIVVDLDGTKLDLPFSTFLQKEGRSILGEKAYKEFEGYFPIRFNYDDTYHSNGNMSIQVHPDEDYVISNYDEFGRQDEAYYVIATGHGAKTYAGFKGDGREFLELAKKSEVDHEDVDYQKYINSVDSVPGRQIMIPAGTIHASGRNQLILELGSLTIGSYTYKVYDYNRKDKDGNTRPIHTKNAEKVLRFERNSDWVKENIAIEPILIDETKEYKEYIVGKTDLMYYETHRIEMEKYAKYEGNNNNQFTVLTVVDGEQIKVYSKSNPEFHYTASFLDIVTIPSTIQDYVVEAEGYQPVVIHKTVLREGYSRYKNNDYWNRK